MMDLGQRPVHYLQDERCSWGSEGVTVANKIPRSARPIRRISHYGSEDWEFESLRARHQSGGATRSRHHAAALVSPITRGRPVLPGLRSGRPVDGPRAEESGSAWRARIPT